MAEEEAARFTDPITHGLGMLGMVAGAIAGAVVGAALIAGAVATGGTLLIAMSVCAAGASVAGGGLAGGQLARGIAAVANLSPTTGALGSGSWDTYAVDLRSARTVVDFAAACHGLYGVNHFPLTLVPIAEGSATVFINDQHASRVKDKLVCGAAIKDGADTVIIGGDTKRVLPVYDAEAALEEALNVLLMGSLAGMFVLSFPLGMTAELIAGVAVFAGLNEGVGWLGDQIGPGWRDVFQGTLGLAALGVTGRTAFRELAKPRPFELIETSQGPLINGRPVEPPSTAAAERNYRPQSEWDTAYKKVNRRGNLDWDWPPDQGFKGGVPPEQPLKPGTLFDRYGEPNGTFVSPYGTPFEARALAPDTVGKPYRVYEVVKEIPARSGEIAPAFDQPGGGIQHKLGQTVEALEAGGYVRQIWPPP
ncbi:MAG: glycohydrolase toxin TNT-related protein [Polyangiales bacterium]